MKSTRKYGLFKKEGEKWIREYPELAYPKETAIHVFQTHLLAFALKPGEAKRELRVVKDQ